LSFQSFGNGLVLNSKLSQPSIVKIEKKICDKINHYWWVDTEEDDELDYLLCGIKPNVHQKMFFKRYYLLFRNTK